MGCRQVTVIELDACDHSTAHTFDCIYTDDDICGCQSIGFPVMGDGFWFLSKSFFSPPLIQVDIHVSFHL